MAPLAAPVRRIAGDFFNSIGLPRRVFFEGFTRDRARRAFNGAPGRPGNGRSPQGRRTGTRAKGAQHRATGSGLRRVADCACVTELKVRPSSSGPLCTDSPVVPVPTTSAQARQAAYRHAGGNL